MLDTRKVYRPIIQPEYFQVFSHSLFMLPRHLMERANDHIEVSLNWEGFPEGYVVQNSFGSNQREQHINNINEEEFHSAVFVGGDFRVYDIDVRGNLVALAIRGEWSAFQDSTLVKALRETITNQREFWQDHSQEYFSVTMIPTVQERGSSFQGTGLTNSFATAASNNDYLEVEGLIYLLNHELQHNWTGHTIKNDNEEEQYWFSEGFTDYYTIKNIAKHRIYNLDGDHFIQEFNSTIRALYVSPVKEAPNSEINYENFWSSQDYEKLPYLRGALFAFYLDQKIKQDTNGEKSLDDLMRDFKDNAEQKITHPYFIETANTYLKEDITPFFNAHIEQGKLLDLNGVFSAFGLEYEPKCKVFDLGFQFSTDKSRIIAIDKDSEAYKLGLRAGDRVVSRSYYHNRTDKKAEFTIDRNGERMPVAYYPVREAEIAQLKPNEKNREVLGF